MTNPDYEQTQRFKERLQDLLMEFDVALMARGDEAPVFKSTDGGIFVYVEELVFRRHTPIGG